MSCVHAARSKGSHSQRHISCAMAVSIASPSVYAAAVDDSMPTKSDQQKFEYSLSIYIISGFCVNFMIILRSFFSTFRLVRDSFLPPPQAHNPNLHIVYDSLLLLFCVLLMIVNDILIQFSFYLFHSCDSLVCSISHLHFHIPHTWAQLWVMCS